MTRSSGTLQRAGVGILVLALAGGLPACSDDDKSTSDSTEAEGSGEASEDFCGAVVDLNSAIFEVELDEGALEADVVAVGEDLAPLSTAVVESAPDGLADVATVVDDAIRPLAEGDQTTFNTDSLFDTYAELVNGSVEACGFPSVEVTGVDFAFEDVPATIEAGTMAFAFTNAAEAEEHEMIVFRKADGVTEEFSELLELSEEEAADKFQFETATFAPPGEASTSLTELEPGAYAMVCFIPVGGEEGADPHYTQGMLQEFTVE